jgi:transaldolase
VTKLHDLYRSAGQSPWLDNLKRSYLEGDGLKKLSEEGIRGVTSNPTIFARAIEGSDQYDDQYRKLIGSMSIVDAYWEMVIKDVTDALGVLRPVYEESDGGDGFVSIEVAPALAHQTEATIEAARYLHGRIELPNLFVKIPATEAGIPAIRAMVAEGRNINITLIFSIERYGEVIGAYQGGLEEYVAGGGDPRRVASVASFFVSRVDTEVDRRLETLAAGAGASDGPAALRGKAAVAQAKLAYQLFLEKFSGPRWQALAAKGAKVQRPLWASTSTKNPEYPDLKYVDSLIGPDTVNTMPDATIDAFVDHGTVRRSIDDGVEEARRALEQLSAVGIDMEDVSQRLEDEGVATFSKSFDELLQRLADKANALAG